MINICSFFGHRDVEITDDLIKRTTNEIEAAINDGCRTFYFGGYSDFDSLCHKIVTSIKEAKPDLALNRVYCVSQEKYLRKKVRYFNKEDYDDVIYLMPSFEGWYKSIYYRNCAMIDNIFVGANPSLNGVGVIFVIPRFSAIYLSANLTIKPSRKRIYIR